MKNMKKSVITAASVLMLGSVLLPSHLTALAAPSGAQQSTAVTKDQAKEIAAPKQVFPFPICLFSGWKRNGTTDVSAMRGNSSTKRQNMNCRSM